MNPLGGSFYPWDDPSRMPFPGEMLKVAQNQCSNNRDALVARFGELSCPLSGGPNSRDDLIVVFVENHRIADDDLVELLFLDDTSEIMEVWEARPISMFACLHPGCRAPIPVRNRKHLLGLLCLDRYFGLRVGAGDLVELEKLCEMLCEGCAQDLRDSHAQELRAAALAREARAAELRSMPWPEYRMTREWRSRRNSVLLRAGNRCELCGARGRLEVHHKTYERYGDELLGDLIALCRSCHQRFHGILPEAA